MAAAVSCGISRIGSKKKESDMTKEQIENAAMEFAEREYEISDIDKIPLYKGFFHGAQWRINSVWHDNSVRPSDDCDVLVETTRRIESDRYDADYNELDSGTDWETEVIRWAYIDDLLPERKEESI